MSGSCSITTWLDLHSVVKLSFYFLLLTRQDQNKYGSLRSFPFFHSSFLEPDEDISQYKSVFNTYVKTVAYSQMFALDTFSEFKK